MVEPDVRVNPDDLDAAGADLTASGAELAGAVRDPAALRVDPAFCAGFDSVAATARLGELWRAELERSAEDAIAQGRAMRAAAEAWRTTDGAVADSLRTG